MSETKPIEPQPALSAVEVHAVRACIEGKASPEQAKLAIEWIAREAARVTDLSYRPERPIETAFNEGRRYVGILIRYMLEPATLAKAQEQDRKRKEAEATK